MFAKSTRILLICLTFFSGIQLQAATGAWTNSAGGNWGTTANWSPNTTPDGIFQQAFFTNNLGAGSIAVNLEAARTINRMTF